MSINRNQLMIDTCGLGVQEGEHGKDEVHYEGF